MACITAPKVGSVSQKLKDLGINLSFATPGLNVKLCCNVTIPPVSVPIPPIGLPIPFPALALIDSLTDALNSALDGVGFVCPLD